MARHVHRFYLCHKTPVVSIANSLFVVLFSSAESSHNRDDDDNDVDDDDDVLFFSACVH